jgi:pimeloyl-ACP methyl ester carboxylesterase
LDLQDVVLVGNSVGGGIAAEMALRLSPRLASTVLINSARIDAGKPELSIPPLCRRRSVTPLHSTIPKIRLRSVDAGSGACDGGQSEGPASLFNGCHGSKLRSREGALPIKIGSRISVPSQYCRAGPEAQHRAEFRSRAALSPVWEETAVPPCAADDVDSGIVDIHVAGMATTSNCPGLCIMPEETAHAVRLLEDASARTPWISLQPD